MNAETSAWSRVTLDRVADRLNHGDSVEELAAILDEELLTDDPRIAELSPAARHRYCVLALTSMLADHWRHRLDVEIATARADAILPWRLIASATGHDTARSAMMSARRLEATPARRNRTAPRPLVPSDRIDDVDDASRM